MPTGLVVVFKVKVTAESKSGFLKCTSMAVFEQSKMATKMATKMANKIQKEHYLGL